MVLKAYDLVLLFSKKKNLLWARPMGTPLLHMLNQNMLSFTGFSKIFSELIGFQLNFLILIKFPNICHWKSAKKIKVGAILGQNLGQIRSNVVKKVKKQRLSLGFFIFYLENPF